jgi:DNA-binding NarL/FixJ family response regulator
MSQRCVLLADAHHNMLEALCGLLRGRFAITVMVTDETSLLDAVPRMEPDLVVVDMSLPVAGSVNIVRTLCSRFNRLRVIVLSVHDDEMVSSHALSAGAAGFVLKWTAGMDLGAAVDAIARGETYISPTLGSRQASGGHD